MKRFAIALLGLLAGCAEPEKPAPPPEAVKTPLVDDAPVHEAAPAEPILRFPNLAESFHHKGRWGSSFVAGDRLFLYYGGPGDMLKQGPVLAQAVRDGSGWKLASQILLVGSQGPGGADLWPGDPPTYVYNGFRDCARPSDEVRFVNLRDYSQDGSLVIAAPPWLASLSNASLKIGFFDGRTIPDPVEVFFANVDDLDMAADAGHAWILANSARKLQFVDLRPGEKYRRRSFGDFWGDSPRVALHHGAPIVAAIFWSTKERPESYAWVADASSDPPRELLKIPGHPQGLSLAVFHDDIVVVLTGAECEMHRGTPERGWKRTPLSLEGIREGPVLFELDGKLCALWQQGAEIVVTPIAE